MLEIFILAHGLTKISLFKEPCCHYCANKFDRSKCTAAFDKLYINKIIDRFECLVNLVMIGLSCDTSR